MPPPPIIGSIASWDNGKGTVKTEKGESYAFEQEDIVKPRYCKLCLLRLLTPHSRRPVPEAQSHGYLAKLQTAELANWPGLSLFPASSEPRDITLQRCVSALMVCTAGAYDPKVGDAVIGNSKEGSEKGITRVVQYV